jgi:hypothetical protein
MQVKHMELTEGRGERRKEGQTARGAPARRTCVSVCSTLSCRCIRERSTRVAPTSWPRLMMSVKCSCGPGEKFRRVKFQSVKFESVMLMISARAPSQRQHGGSKYGVNFPP